MMKKQIRGFIPVLICLCLCLFGCTSEVSTREGSESDILAGTSWIAAGDGSQLVFNTDKSYAWYRSKDETDDNYFAGTYEAYIGQAAMDYLTGELSEYGITPEEMQPYFDRNEEYGIDNFICFTVNNESFLINGEEQLSGNKENSYFGFLLLDGTYLDIANMTTGTYYGFSKE